MVGIELRNDYSADDLRALARKLRDAKQARRVMALAAVANGLSRTDAAEIGLMDRQTLRDHCPAGHAKYGREEGCTGSTHKGRTV
jgi:hypothetical protein